MILDLSPILVGVSLSETNCGRILKVDKTPISQYIMTNGEDLFIETFRERLDARWPNEQFKTMPDGLATQNGCFTLEFLGRTCTLCFAGYIELKTNGSEYVVEYTCTRSNDGCNCCCF